MVNLMHRKSLRIYVENSVISAYYYASGWMLTATKRFFNKAVEENYELFTSDVTILELDSAREDIRENILKIIQEYRIKVVSITDMARRLAEEYVARGMIPGKYRADAEHIAIASVEGFDALASWNLRHIVKLKTKSMVKLINKEMGCSVPEIIRPDEVL